MSVLSWNRYGKSRIRLVKVRRPAAPVGQTDAPHEVVDLTIDVQLEGAFEPVYVEGDNSRCLATDTMKNMVYALARQDPIDHVESFALKLADCFYANPAVSHARISAFEHRWDRLSVHGRPHPHAFAQPGGEQWTTVVTRDAQGVGIASGLANLVLMKTADSAFAGFRDEYTTLPETGDRVLATLRHRLVDVSSGDERLRGARPHPRRARADVRGRTRANRCSTRCTRWRTRRWPRCADVTAITLTLPNRHHLLVDLAPFGLDNPTRFSSRPISRLV